MGTQIDLRDDAATIEKLAKNKQKPLTQVSSQEHISYHTSIMKKKNFETDKTINVYFC